MSPELEDRIMEAVLRSAFLYHGQVVGFEASRVREAIREVLKDYGYTENEKTNR